MKDCAMTIHYDALETRDPAHRESTLLAALPGQVAHAQGASSAFARILQGVNAADVTSREALARLPVVRKHELLELQLQGRQSDCFGGFSAVPAPVRFTNRRAPGPTTGAWRGPSLRPGSVPAS
jgi:phenylacetate-CoA ligase